MKPKTRTLKYCVALATLPLLPPASAQTEPPVTETEETALKATGAGYSIVRRGPHDRVWLKTASFTNETGVLTFTTNSFTEVATGMHYSENGEWKESRDLIELTPEGAAATHAGCKAYFGQNLAAPGAVKLVTVKGRSAETRPIGLYYHDVASGKAVQLGALRDCAGELLPPNQIVWKSIFDNIEADFRVTYTKALLEGDLILRQRPKPPQAYNLDPATTRLEVWHEWRGLSSPNQRRIAVKRPAALHPGGPPQTLEDNLLEFEDLFFVHGRAFVSNETEARPANVAAGVRIPNPNEPTHTPVGKEWHDMPGRSILAEAVCWPDLEPKLAGLPEMAAIGTPSMARDRLLCLREATGPTRPSASSKPIQLARAEYWPTGVVVDWTTVSDTGNYVFNRSQTYYILSGYFGGHVVFWDFAVLKFEPGSYLLLYGTVECHGGGSISATLLTSRDDDLYIEKLDGLSTHNPTYAADPALWIYYTTQPMDFSGMRIRWAHTGILCSGSASNSLATSTLEMCETGVWAHGPGVLSLNLLCRRCGVVTPYGGVPDDDFHTGTLTDFCPDDYDHDGLPDTWECQYFGDRTAAQATGDPDGDCHDNLYEYHAGTNPNEFPEITAQLWPPQQTVHTGVNVTYTVGTRFSCANYQWYRSPDPSGPFTPVSGATGPSLQLYNVGMDSDYTFYKVQVANNLATLESSTVQLDVNDDFWQAVYNSYYITHQDNTKSPFVWAQRPTGTAAPSPPPTLAWNNGTPNVFSRMSNRSAISGWMYHENAPNTQVPYTLLSPRHAYMRGHGVGTCGLHGNWDWGLRKVWFCPADNSGVVEGTIAYGYTKSRLDCPLETSEDFTIVMFEQNLEGIEPVSVMVAPPGVEHPYHPSYIAPVYTAQVSVWDDHHWGADWYFGGDSGAPYLIPAPNNLLVFYAGADTSGPSTAMQSVMDDLSTRMGLNTNEYQLTWYTQP